MKQDTQSARDLVQDAGRKMQDTRESLAFIRAFMSETQPIAREDAQDETRVTQMLERAIEPRAELSEDVIRRLITWVECLA
jgi:hypothetical protein